MTYELPPLARDAHDPNAGLSGPWTGEIPLDDGITLAGTPTVTAVDKNDVPLLGDTLAISDVTFDVISGSLWGVSFSLLGGSVGTVYRIRISYSTSDGHTFHRTMRIRCAQN